MPLLIENPEAARYRVLPARGSSFLLTLGVSGPVYRVMAAVGGWWWDVVLESGQLLRGAAALHDEGASPHSTVLQATHPLGCAAGRHLQAHWRNFESWEATVPRTIPRIAPVHRRGSLRVTCQPVTQ